MFWRYVFMMLVLVGVGLAFYPSKPPPPKPALPEIAFTLPDGSSSSLTAFEGNVTLIHFWASWCPPCLPELPELVELAEANPDQLTILAFSLDKTARDMQRFLDSKFKTLPPNFIAIWDEGGQLARDSFQSFSYPETYIIGCDGQLEDKVIGAASDWERTLAPHVKACIK